MPLLNLSQVTQSITTLLSRSVAGSPEWDALNVLNVSAQPPDRLAGDFALGFYLYHVMEDPAYKNPPPLADVDNPDALHPMGLQLYYVLTARSNLSGDASAFAEQLMMGLAMKALRDISTLNDETLVGGLPVFPPALIGRRNQFRISLQPPEARESMAYWMAGSQPMRLAAYYHVAPVLLEPEPQSMRPGRVSLYGVHTFVRGRPRLDGSRSRVAFTPPGELVPRQVEARPAEACLGQQIVFLGTDLSGTETRLEIQHVSWPFPVEVDSMQWGVTATNENVFATVAAFAGSNPVLPGLYIGAVRVVTRRTMPDGASRDFPSVSNQTGFAITPFLNTITFAAGGLGTVIGGNFDPALLPGDQVQLFTGAERLTRVTGAPAAGEFQVVDANTIEFRMPAALVTGDVVAFRVLIRGAESAPRWVTAP
jgi:hypothetical protein